MFRRSRRRREELQAFLHTLSPELPAQECCRRALAQVIRVMRLRGAAILLRDGATLREGAISFGSLEALWRRGPRVEAFPPRPLVGYELRELPGALIETLGETDIVGVVPIFSPHQRWGVLLISTGLLRATFSDEDEQTLDAFADQLARVLDAADLLARTVAVERSLAHSEKLAAIGELAARMAHEIRNPVAAACSLAQQLARDPVSPLNAEHAELILTELQRVERQVAGLLRFARREEFRFEVVDVSELVRITTEQFRGRCEAAGIALEIDTGDGITAQLDREKIRQVVINLIENAIDALGSNTEARQLSVAVARADGSATVRVMDNGAGITPDLLPRLFEPFFSLKPHGTGLGLAIAKRTVEAHGGRIEAASQAGTGTTFSIALPLESKGLR